MNFVTFFSFFCAKPPGDCFISYPENFRRLSRNKIRENVPRILNSNGSRNWSCNPTINLNKDHLAVERNFVNSELLAHTICGALLDNTQPAFAFSKSRKVTSEQSGKSFQG